MEYALTESDREIVVQAEIDAVDAGVVGHRRDVLGALLGRPAEVNSSVSAGMPTGLSPEARSGWRGSGMAKGAP